MENKKAFLVYKEWGILLSNLPPAEAGELVKMMCAYAFDGEEITSDNPVLNATFSMIKKRLDEDAVAYEETVSKKSEAGKKGMAKRWGNKDSNTITEDNTVITNDNTVTKSITKITDKDNDNDNVNDNVKDNESPTETKKKVKKEKAPALTLEQMECMIDESMLSSLLLDKVKDWIRYKQARNEPYKEMGFKSLLSQIHKYEMQDGVDAVVDVIDLSMSNDWKGIIWEKIEHHNKAQPGRGQPVDWSKV